MYGSSLLPFRQSDQKQNEVLILVNATQKKPEIFGKDVQLVMRDIGISADVVIALPGSISIREKVLSSGARTVIIICDTGQCVLDIRDLAVNIIWDVKFVDLEACEIKTSEQRVFGPDRSVFHAALARADSVVGCYEELSLKLETDFSIGIKLLGYVDAFRFINSRVAVLLGSGLGNMMYATPLVRWLSEKVNAPVDVIIHTQHGGAVELFNRADFVHRVFPTPAFCGERHYKFLMHSSSAAHLEVPLSADVEFRQNKLFDYNLDGRFVPEPELYFYGLSRFFDDVPPILESFPKPFLRNVKYEHPKNKTVGFANGIKTGTWAKRQWPYIEQLVKKLTEDGFEMRCFGLPEEYVEGSVDFTGLSIRETIEEISNCSYFIGHDCGITHIAEVLGVPTAWIFGPTVATKNGPIMAHSELIKSDIACSPCQFRVDWARCENAVCMSGQSLEEVADKFHSMVSRIEKNGIDTSWRIHDTGLIAKEIENSFSPCSEPVQPGVIHERISAYPKNATFAAKLVLGLLQRQDLVGAADVTRAFLNDHFHDKIAVQALREAIDTFYPFPTPSGYPTQSFPLLSTGDSASAILIGFFEMMLSDKERRAVIQLLVSGYRAHGGHKAAFAFLKEVFANRVFVNGLEEEVVDSEFALFNDDGSTIYSNALRRKIIRQGVQSFIDELDTYADTEAKLVGVPKSEILTNKFRFPLDAAAPRDSVTIPLHLGSQTRRIPYFANVLLFTKNTDPKNATAGRASSLAIRHAQQLVRMGLSPIIVSLANESSKPLLEFRASIFYIYTGLNWSPEHWVRAMENFNVQLCLSYGNLDDVLSLPEAWAEMSLTVSTEGLYDNDGLIQLLAPGSAYDLRETNPSKTNFDLTANDVTHALIRMSPTPRQAAIPEKPDRNRYILLVNKIQDIELARSIAARLPDQMFVVCSDVMNRIVMPNMECVGRLNVLRTFDDGKPVNAVVELTLGETNLSDVAIYALERDIQVLSGCEMPDDFFAHLLSRPDDISSPDSWRRAILRLMRAQS